jgi:hypothetical protein
MKKAYILLIFAMLLMLKSINAQILPPDTALNKARFYPLVAIESSLWGGSITALYFAWYANYNQGKWHTFNDNKEWLQVDKVGHATTSYYLGKFSYDMFRWTGLSHNKSLWYGGGLGFMYLTSIEMLDAYSNKWGFSWGDMAANATGTALFISQAAIWHEQRISMKISFHQTKYSQIRPSELGSYYLENMIKDYNGQSLWLSANIYSFLPEESSFPKWLNIAVGYGADGMIGGFSNPSMVGGMPMPHYARSRQYYVSVDVDWTRIETRSKFLKTVFNLFSFIKMPAPALEFSNGGVGFHPIYY